MQSNTLQSGIKRIRGRRVGRGGKRGKTSGRGGKGQTARSGHRIRPEMRDTIKRLPKRRGYGKNRGRAVVSSRIKPTAVSLQAIATHFDSGAVISPLSLSDKGLVQTRRGRLPAVKIVGMPGVFKTKITVEGCAVTEGAKVAIEKVGGSIA